MEHDITADARYVRSKYPCIEIEAQPLETSISYRFTFYPGDGEHSLITKNEAVFWSIVKAMIEYDERAGAGK